MCFFRENNESEKNPVNVERKPIKAERKPIKVERKPIKGDRKPIKVDRNSLESGRKWIKVEGEPGKADKKPIKDDRKAIIIKYVSENGFITNKQAREMLGLADSTTKRILKEMVMEGKLLIEGERKARKYLLKE